MAGRRRGARIAMATAIVLAMVLALAVTASGQSSDSSSTGGPTTSLNYSGTFTTVDGTSTQQLGAMPNSVDLVVHASEDRTSDTFTLTAKLAIPGTLYDENGSSQNDLCIRFEIAAQDQPLPKPEIQDSTTYEATTIPVTDTSLTDQGCGQSGSPQRQQGSIQLTLNDDRGGTNAHGVLAYDRSKYEFEAPRVGDTPDTAFLEGKAITKDLFVQALSKSTCPSSKFDQDYEAQPQVCRDLRALRQEFYRFFVPTFHKEDVIRDMSNLVLLRALETEDGQPLMRTLSALSPIISRLALKADNPDDDGTAQSAMNRLITFAIAIDLAAAA